MKKVIGKATDNMKKTNYTDTHEHSHSKGGLLGQLKGLVGTKTFGAKHGARHRTAQEKALKKKRGESTFPF